MADENSRSAERKGERVLLLGEGMSAFLTTIRSLGRKGVQVDAAWCPPESPALRSRYVTKYRSLPPPSAGEAACKSLCRLVESEQYDLVIPTNEQSVVSVQRAASQSSDPSRFYLLSPDAAAKVFNKELCGEIAESLGIPVPRSRRVADLREAIEAARDLGYPLVLKPLSSYNAAHPSNRRNVIKAADDEELLRSFSRLPANEGLLIQEHFRGIGVGVELLAYQGQILTVFQHQRVHEPPRGGASSYRRSVPVRTELRAAAERLVAHLQYTGVMMVEFLVDPQTQAWRFVEINARFWGSLPLAVAAGADFPWFLYQMLVHNRRDFPTEYRHDLYCRNLAADTRWLIQQIRLPKSTTVATKTPLRTVAAEFRHLLLGKERWDELTWDDPKPAIFQLYLYAKRFADRLSLRVTTWSFRLPGKRNAAVQQCLRAVTDARSIHFVCLGNICRSPFAERLARRLLSPSVEITSSGLLPREGRPSPTDAITTATDWDVALDDHRSQTVNAETMSRADLVFTFDEAVHAELLRRFPEIKAKTHRFALLTNDSAVEIADPFEKPLAAFQATYRQIAHGVQRIVERQGHGSHTPAGCGR